MTRILITGAEGNIGAELMRNFDPSLGTAVSFEGNILSADLSSWLTQVTVVIHLAALTDVDQSHRQADLFHEVNLRGLQRIADACRDNGTKLLFPSTTSIYSSSASIVDETCRELRAYSPYAASKLAAERYLLELKEQGLQFVICRFGTIFGYSPGMRFNTAVNKFMWEALHGKPLSVWRTAWKQKRPYLALSDCIEAIHFILRHDLFDGEIYNVMTGNYTVEQVVNTIRECIPTLTIGLVDSPAMNPLSYEVNDKKIRDRGFQAKGNLRTGIHETIAELVALKS